MDIDELNQISMTMLSRAGKAKQLLNQALVAMEQSEVDEVIISKYLQDAKQTLIEAHKAQNQAIKHSDTLTYSLLFTHAQDTLMNTEESLFLVQHFIKIINSKLK
ncbi:PTS lactose/cellobiose transporter subunit IIA [Lentilactobacillus senioris]|uniref:PTS lactose/cellobiose transporter subunit IIA n=1 Tax=Lentilactobacillus senioris TaxID=931534 RepID=UPI002281BAAF|nr:PTS lactose/cellobiose transporter subunit IIA [Lentilactobacillus senioris]MCY9807109.1 PTS lactose/cellobiose transporter subunit IIA [Lentilactobacillus senioris]